MCSWASIWSSCFEISGPSVPLLPFKKSLAAIFQCDSAGGSQFEMSCSCSLDVSHTFSQGTPERMENRWAAEHLGGKEHHSARCGRPPGLVSVYSGIHMRCRKLWSYLPSQRQTASRIYGSSHDFAPVVCQGDGRCRNSVCIGPWLKESQRELMSPQSRLASKTTWNVRCCFEWPLESSMTCVRQVLVIYSMETSAPPAVQSNRSQ